jgi:hypothetical protein
VIRYFAKLVRVKKGAGMNVLIFDTTSKQVSQITTDGLNLVREAQFTDFRYNDDLDKLTFVVNGRIEEMRIYEISENTFKAMQRPDNWKNLCHGLSIASPKTLDWCVNHRIYSG